MVCDSLMKGGHGRWHEREVEMEDEVSREKIRESMTEIQPWAAALGGLATVRR